MVHLLTDSSTKHKKKGNDKIHVGVYCQEVYVGMAESHQTADCTLLSDNFIRYSCYIKE